MWDVLSRSELETPQLSAVVRALQSQSINYDGPFVTSKGRIVFRVENKVVLDWELMILLREGKLDPADVSTLLSRIKA